MPSAKKILQKWLNKIKSEIENQPKFIKSTKRKTELLSIYTHENGLTQKTVTYIPVIYNIFDEFVKYLAMRKQIDPLLDRIEFFINPGDGSIVVVYTGEDSPFEFGDDGVKIFGHVFNYAEMEKTTNYGVLLTIIFSSTFVFGVYTTRYLLSQKIFQDKENMCRMLDTVYRRSESSEKSVKVEFKPNLNKFNTTCLEEDIVALMNRRVVELGLSIATCPGKKVKVLLNNIEIKANDFDKCAQIYLNTSLPRIGDNSKENLKPRIQFSPSISDWMLERKMKLDKISQLKDAKLAGGIKSELCTLILTCGGLAYTLAMAGLSVVDRDYYGVYDLQSKLPNVTEATHYMISNNYEFCNLMKILGLKEGVNYDEDHNFNSLRYGHLMIMTNQDNVGYHIRGRIINFFHTFWPSLLRKKSFVCAFIPPKDLGSCHLNDGKEYFRNLQNHKKDFSWVDESDSRAVELAFGKNAENRLKWLMEDEVTSVLDYKKDTIRYSDFVHMELKLYFKAALRSSIPSMVDGFIPVQRKVLFTAFKENLVEEIQVYQFSKYVFEKSAYCHDVASIPRAIVGMAHKSVGSNIRFLVPTERIGHRILGGKDAGSLNSIHTKLADITRYIFHEEDDIVLTYLKENGKPIEPVWYMPIIPTILVNGFKGVESETETGLSTFVPSYNPNDIIANIRCLIKNEPLVPMEPWYNKFEGTIKKKEDTARTYIATGVIDEVEDSGEEDFVTLKITELPVGWWPQDYKNFLCSLSCNSFDERNESFIQDLRDDYAIDDTTCFKVILSKEKYDLAKQEGLEKKFKLTSTFSTDNMYLFDKDNKLVKYESPEKILEDFYDLRMKYYAKRIEENLKIYEEEYLKLQNQVKYIQCVREGKIGFYKGKRVKWVNELENLGFYPIPKNVTSESGEKEDGFEKSEEDELENLGFDPIPKNVTSESGEKEDGFEKSEVDELEDLGSESSEDDGLESSSDDDTNVNFSCPSFHRNYDYLLSIAPGSMTPEKVKVLTDKAEKLRIKIEQLTKNSAQSLYERDLDALKKFLDEHDDILELGQRFATYNLDKSVMETDNPEADAKKPSAETEIADDEVSMLAKERRVSLASGEASKATEISLKRKGQEKWVCSEQSKAEIVDDEVSKLAKKRRVDHQASKPQKP